MPFTSISFLFYFLPIILAVYFICPGIKSRNAALLIFSAVFYLWGDLGSSPVLLIETFLTYRFGIALENAPLERRGRMLAMMISLLLLTLGVFKYLAFIAANVSLLLAPLGVRPAQIKLTLPLGISFFTFHCLSYLIDVYRKRFPANRNLTEVALYIMLFPQLIAGPIVRYRVVARQLHQRRHEWWRATKGVRIFIIGLAQKLLIADQVAPLADAVFDHVTHPSMAEAWGGLLAYTMQIYFDFAGYSAMAVGLGLIFGFSLPRNFRLPYTSQSVTEFWRRWHMSLSSWLRDYLYIPLGGSRGGKWQTYRNLVTVFLLCGLWHGASWNFLLWGAWHGGFLVIERLAGGRDGRLLPAPFGWAFTLLAVMGGWVLFRAHDLPAAGHFYAGMLGGNGLSEIHIAVHASVPPVTAPVLLIGCVFAVLPRWVRMSSTQARSLLGQVGLQLSSLAMLALSLLQVASGTYSPFLYFRF